MACCCVAATAEPLGLLSLRRFSSGDLFPAIHLLLCSSSHASTSMPNESDAGTAAGVAWAGAPSTPLLLLPAVAGGPTHFWDSTLPSGLATQTALWSGLFEDDEGIPLLAGAGDTTGGVT